MAISGKPLQAITFDAATKPLLFSDYDPANNKQWWFMRDYQTDGGVVLLSQNIATSSALCMDLSNGITQDGTRIQGWQYVPNNPNQIWRLADATDLPTSVRSDLLQIVKSVFDTAKSNSTFTSVLHTDPAPIFVAAGYPLHDNDYDSFNKFFINTFKENGDVLCRDPAAVDPSWLVCAMCKTSLYVFALGVVVLAGGGLALIHEGAAPVIALAAAMGISARVMAGMLLGLAASVITDVMSLVSKLCTWVHACNESAA